MPTSAAASLSAAPGQVDMKAIKARQRAAWSSGDYAVVGTTLQIVGEELCEAIDIRAGQTVLDVAAGIGNVSLAAARRWCDVTAFQGCWIAPANAPQLNASISSSKRPTPKRCLSPMAALKWSSRPSG